MTTSIPRTRPAGARARRSSPGTKKPGWRCSTDDAIVEDPIGPSASTPKAKATAAATRYRPSGTRPSPPPTKIEFVFRDTYQCGNEEANVGHILITTGDYQTTAEGVFTYKANDDGKMVALRAYWEIDQATASVKKID